jgi:hypothetical protein
LLRLQNKNPNDQGAKSNQIPSPNDQIPKKILRAVIPLPFGLLLLNFFPTLQSFSGRGGQ